VWRVPLDFSRRAALDDAAIAAVAGRSRSGALLAEMVHGYGDRAESGWRLHDALVVAAIVDPEIIVTRPALVDVDTGPGLSRAQTLCAFDMPIEGWGGHGFPVIEPAIPERLRLAVGLDVERFRALLLARVAAVEPVG